MTFSSQAPPGWVRFDTLSPGDKLHEVECGEVVQYVKIKNFDGHRIIADGVEMTRGFNAVDVQTGDLVSFEDDEYVYPTNVGWIAELACYGFKIPENIDKTDHRAVLAYVMSHCEARKANDNWRSEIEKYLPQLGVMSFAGASRVIRWLMDHVDIKPEHATLANKLKAIESSDLSDDEKVHQRLESIFPNLKRGSHGGAGQHDG